jgi:NAD-dependent dihydropyrimidine dehydrogenase PreA subunit
LVDKKPKAIPNFNYETCNSCGACEGVCPLSCIEMKHLIKKRPYPKLAKPEKCTSCKQCEKICPVDAIKLERINVLVK